MARAVALVAVVIGLGACGGSTSPAAQAADQRYLATVHSGAPDISAYRSDVQLTRLGHAVCDGFRSGASFQQLADRLALVPSSRPLPSEDLGTVITAAVDAYCPAYDAQIGGS